MEEESTAMKGIGRGQEIPGSYIYTRSPREKCDRFAIAAVFNHPDGENFHREPTRVCIPAVREGAKKVNLIKNKVNYEVS